MVAYSFQPRFAEPILAGTKGGTIRATRKFPARWSPYARSRHPGGHAAPGQDLDLYTGMRTKHCRLIWRTVCAALEPIGLDFSGAAIAIGVVGHKAKLEIFGAEALDAFAVFDGFEDWAALRQFWREAHGDLTGFAGWHIRWLPLPDWWRDA